MSFYVETPEPGLRFGDVVIGFVATSTEFKVPCADTPPAWRLKVTAAKYFAVLSPCCSIERGTLLLAPLLPVRAAFLSNAHLASDLLRLNEPVAPERQLPEHAWERLPDEEKTKRLAEGDAFIFMECFIFAPHPLLGKYMMQLKSGPEEHAAYMIDFSTAFRLECDAIARDKPAPPGTKLLQLTIRTRGLLRSKVAAYFNRIPDEDLVGVNG